MRCPWCANTNFPPRTHCAHCNEELFPEPDEDDRDAPLDEEDEARAAVVVARFRSVAVSVGTLAVLTFGGWTSYDHWPTPPPLVGEPIPVPSTEPSPDPAARFTEMNALLRSVRSTRSRIPPTLGSCVSVSSDAEALERIVQERDEQANEATALDVTGMPNGDAIKEALVAMAQATADADEQYRSWAEESQTTGQCVDVPEDGTIGTANQTAADAKRAFVSLWNADAPSYGQRKYKWTDF
jgi:rubredoxin-like zinc ribbon protein